MAKRTAVDVSKLEAILAEERPSDRIGATRRQLHRCVDLLCASQQYDMIDAAAEAMAGLVNGAGALRHIRKTFAPKYIGRVTSEFLELAKGGENSPEGPIES